MLVKRILRSVHSEEKVSSQHCKQAAPNNVVILEVTKEIPVYRRYLCLPI